MGKRSSFERNPRDYYPTPDHAIEPLLPHLHSGVRFVEPCAGDGRLTDFLVSKGHHCVAQYDLEPQRDDVKPLDTMRHLCPAHCQGAEMIITNPPWGREILHPMIKRFTMMLPTWLLFDADWKHTAQAEEFMPMLRKVVSVGRVKWIEGSKNTGKDNAAWYLFDRPNATLPVFVGRKSVRTASVKTAKSRNIEI